MQTLTVGVRLPSGPHDAALDALGAFFGAAERALHARKREIETDFEAFLISKEEAKARRKDLKPAFMAEWGLTGRQYNSLDRGLDGRYASVRECAKLNAASLEAAIAGTRKTIARVRKKLDKDVQTRTAVAERQARGKLPTKAQTQALLGRAQRAKDRAFCAAKTQRLATLERRLAAAQAVADAAVPSVLFGGRDLFAARQRIHPNDAAGLAAWRGKWEKARSGNVLFVGCKSETARNQTCQALPGPDGWSLRLRLPNAHADVRLPDGLTPGGFLSLPLPADARTRALLARALSAADADSAPIAYRFVRDQDWPASRTMSAWRVMITLSVRTDGGETRARVAGPAFGVDVNADCVAAALVSADGNPLARMTLPLGLKGLSTEQRRDRISVACSALVAAAHAAGAVLVIEALDFTRKKREISRDSGLFTDARYARMLSAFAYAQVLSDLVRKAERAGVRVRRVNPAYTSRIGAVNFAGRYGMSRHEAAAVAIARRGQGASERINYVHGPRGRRTQRPAPEDAGRSVWSRWARLTREHLRGGRPADHVLPRVAERSGNGPGNGACGRPPVRGEPRVGAG